MTVWLSERTQRGLGAALLAGYAATCASVAVWSYGPRAFWTGFFPLLPIGIVLMGYHSWRKLCPLAAIARAGAKLPRNKQRRVHAFFEKHSYTVSLGALAFSLAVRLLFINGDGVALALFLVAIALAAFGTGAVYTGKTWCNFFCPVGIVEKIYTEPRSLYAHGNSQCPKCTACKKHCPDIDAENHYWKEIDVGSRRTAYFAFPGLVWGFYTAFALPRGTLDDYFSGAWTRVPSQYRLLGAPGLFFAERVPRAVVMPAFLLICMALSVALFTAIERAIARRVDPQRARHYALTLAAFAAFTSFYLFAGQPTWRRVPGLPVAASVATVLIGTLALVRRWGRDEEAFVQERSVKKILARWPYDEPAPRDPREVFAFVKSKERERDKILAVYADAIRDVLADGVVDRSEQRMLEKLRTEFGITTSEHDKVMARLSAEDRALFDPARAVSIEQRAQEQGYRVALGALLVSRPRNAEIEALRRSYGIETAEHARILSALRASDSPLRQRALEYVNQIDGWRRVLADVTSLVRVRAFQWLYLVLLRSQRGGIARVLELLAVVGGEADRTRAIATRVFDDSAEVRADGWRMLSQLDTEIARRLESAVLSPKPPAATATDPAALRATLETMVSGTDAMLAAAAIVALAVSSPDALAGRTTALATHAHPLVREACALAVSMVEPGSTPLLEALAADRDEHVSATARSLLVEARLPARGEGLAAQLTTRAAAHLLATARDGSVQGDGAAFTTLPTPERMLVLASIALFADLEPQQLYDLAVLATERNVPADGELCREGDRGDEVYIVIAGSGSVSRGEGEARVVVDRVRAGDCVGEMAVLDPAPRAATVRAHEGLRALVIEGAAFRALMAAQPDLANAVLAMIARRLRNLLARVPNASGPRSVESGPVRGDGV